MICFITGVGGFVGSTLADRLLRDGHSVRGIDCFVPYYDRSIKEANLKPLLENGKFEFYEQSLLDADLTTLTKDVDWIFHQAGQAGVRASWGSYFESYLSNNIYATQKLLEECKQHSSLKKFVFASSSSVYGDAEMFPTSESVVPRPVSPYGVTKLAAEHLVSLYNSQYAVPAISLRYFTVYGPKQRPDMAFHRFIKAALKQEELHLYGDGEQSRDFTFIDDIVEINIKAASSTVSAGVYNVGGGAQTTVNGVLEMIREKIGPIRIRREEKQLGDARHTSADTKLARDKLGFSPKIALVEGISREIEWMESALRSGVIR